MASVLADHPQSVRGMHAVGIVSEKAKVRDGTWMESLSDPTPPTSSETHVNPAAQTEPVAEPLASASTSESPCHEAPMAHNSQQSDVKLETPWKNKRMVTVQSR